MIGKIELINDGRIKINSKFYSINEIQKQYLKGIKVGDIITYSNNEIGEITYLKKENTLKIKIMTMQDYKALEVAYNEFTTNNKVEYTQSHVILINDIIVYSLIIYYRELE